MLFYHPSYLKKDKLNVTFHFIKIKNSTFLKLNYSLIELIFSVLSRETKSQLNMVNEEVATEIVIVSESRSLVDSNENKSILGSQQNKKFYYTQQDSALLVNQHNHSTSHFKNFIVVFFIFALLYNVTRPIVSYIMK